MSSIIYKQVIAAAGLRPHEYEMAFQRPEANSYANKVEQEINRYSNPANYPFNIYDGFGVVMPTTEATVYRKKSQEALQQQTDYSRPIVSSARRGDSDIIIAHVKDKKGQDDNKLSYVTVSFDPGYNDTTLQLAANEKVQEFSVKAITAHLHVLTKNEWRPQLKQQMQQAVVFKLESHGDAIALTKLLAEENRFSETKLSEVRNSVAEGAFEHAWRSITGHLSFHRPAAARKDAAPFQNPTLVG